MAAKLDRIRVGVPVAGRRPSHHGVVSDAMGVGDHHSRPGRRRHHGLEAPVEQGSGAGLPDATAPGIEVQPDGGVDFVAALVVNREGWVDDEVGEFTVSSPSARQRGGRACGRRGGACGRA